MKNNTQRHDNRAERAESLKAAIIRLLDCTDEDYAKMQYSTGLVYLKSYLEDDKYAADLLSRSKIFWSWWKNHWTNRDEEFISLNKEVLIKNVVARRQLYEQYNAGTMLAECIHPNSVILNETYADMMTDLVKGETMAI